MASARTAGQWSPWFNSDRPWLGSGDVETLSSIEHHFGPICGFREVIEATQCQVTKYGEMFTEISAHNLRDKLKIPCTSKGLLCVNSHQHKGMCHDYAVRFLCSRVNGSDVNTDSQDYFPQFDARIYIILAVVPILVFLLRLLWGFVSRRRRQQRRRARRNRNGGSGGGDDDDSSSIASSLAHAPPSYHQLFGDLGTNRTNGSSNAIFAITRSTISVCQSCNESKCSVAKALSPSSSHSISNSSNPNETSNSQGCVGHGVVIPISENTLQNIVEHSVRIEDGGSLTASGSSILQQNDSQRVNQTQLHSNQQTDNQPSASVLGVSNSNTSTSTINEGSAQTQNIPMSTIMQIEEDCSTNSTSTQNVSSTTEFNSQSTQLHDIAHSSSPNTFPRDEELILTATNTNSNTPSNSNGISPPCPCVCHRTVAISSRMGRSISSSGFDNEGFQAVEGDEVEVMVAHSSAVAPILQRVYSNLSNGSVITLSELPTYEDALDLIKKKEQKFSE